MKKINPLTGLLILTLSLTSCISPGDEIKKAFETVNRSASLSLAVRDSSVTYTYKSIDSLRKGNEQLASKADAIYFVTVNTTNFIDSIKTVMVESDPSGRNTHIPTRLLVNQKTGNDIAEKLLNVQRIIATYHAHDTIKAKLDSALQLIKEIRNNPDWPEVCFLNTPTIAARANLTVYETCCMGAAQLVLDDIKKHLSN